MKQIWLTGWFLLLCVGLRAQDFVTHNGSVSFFGKKPFESVRADDHDVDGTIHTGTGEVEFHALIKSFHFKNKDIESAFDKKYMEADKYPETGFTGKIVNIGDVNFNKPGDYPIVVAGNFTIHNVSRRVSHPATLTVTKNGLIAKSQFTVKPQGFKVKVPKLLGQRLVKEINVAVDMKFTPANAGAEKTSDK